MERQYIPKYRDGDVAEVFPNHNDNDNDKTTTESTRKPRTDNKITAANRVLKARPNWLKKCMMLEHRA